VIECGVGSCEGVFDGGVGGEAEDAGTGGGDEASGAVEPLEANGADAADYEGRRALRGFGR